MDVLDYKESWVPKNWCFWTVVLQKTLENPLDCKEIQPVNPKGNQSWIFIGRTDAEAETPILWPTDSLKKTLMLGKIEGRKRRDNRRWDGWMPSPTQWTWVWEPPGVGDGQGGLAHCSPCGRKESDMTEWLSWILWHSAFFMVQLSHLYITTGKIIALAMRIFVSKVIFLLFHTLSSFAIAFLPRSKCLLIYGFSHHLQWFFEPRKIKSLTVSVVPPSFCHEVMGPDAMIFIFWMLSFKPALSLSSFTLI